VLKCRATLCNLSCNNGTFTRSLTLSYERCKYWVSIWYISIFLLAHARICSRSSSADTRVRDRSNFSHEPRPASHVEKLHEAEAEVNPWQQSYPWLETSAGCLSKVIVSGDSGFRGAFSDSCIRPRRGRDISSSSEEARHEVTNVISEAIHAGRPIGSTECLTSRDRYRASFRFAPSSLPLERRSFVQIALHILFRQYITCVMRYENGLSSYSFLPRVRSSPADASSWVATGSTYHSL
jgi:hypothetical protein